MKRIYISGKISGLPIEEVKAKFQTAEDNINRMGNYPVNPLKNGLYADATWWDHMSKDISMLLECDQILMLPCWKHSRGARIEHFIAREMGIQVVQFKKK